MNFLLLAASWYAISYPDPTNPRQTITSITETMPDANSFIPSDTEIADAAMRANPVKYQREPFSYQELENRYPIMDVAPKNRQYQIPIEEEMAMEDYKTKRMTADVNIRGNLLNQKIAQKNLEFNDEIINQATQIQSRLGAIKTGAEDFDAEIAALGIEFPLAMQNPSVREQIGRLAQTNNQLVNDKDVAMKYGQQVDDRTRFYEEKQEQDILQAIAPYGPEAIKIYESKLVPDDTGFITPQQRIKAYAEVAGEINRQKASQIEKKPMTPQQVQSEVSRLRSQATKIMKAADVKDPKELTGDLLEDYKAVRENIRQLSGGSKTGKLQTAPPTTFFPKPSTKSGP